MPSLIYAPVYIPNLLQAVVTLANTFNHLGFCPPHHGDEHLHAAHRPTSLHMEA